jgi:hypothetical protein
MPDQNPNDLFGEVIFAYTRAQAIADGVLVDVSNRAKRFAIRFPVALTAALYAAITRDADTDTAKDLCLDLLLITMRRKIATATGPTDRIDFTVKMPHAPAIDIYALCTPGDTPDPVITVMLPHED